MLECAVRRGVYQGSQGAAFIGQLIAPQAGAVVSATAYTIAALITAGTVEAVVTRSAIRLMAICGTGR